MHKKKLFILLSSIIITNFSYIYADNVEEANYTTAKVKDGLYLNVRNSKDEIIYKAKAGEELKVKSYSGEKIEIETKNNDDGYVESKYVDITESRLYIKVDYINMRSDKNTNSKVQTELKKGDYVIVLNSDGEWLKVRNGDKEGYIKAKYLGEKEESEDITLNQVKVINMGDTDAQDLDYIKNIEKNNTRVREYLRKLNSEDTKYSIDSILVENNNMQQVPHANKFAAQKLLNLAYEKQGCPYVWGAEGENSFDCSGLTMWAYKNALGIDIPRVSRDQADVGKEVDRYSLEAGDLVFFATGESRTRISHVGIYVGDGKMIHAPHTGSYVKVQDITTSFYKDRFVKATRLI